MGDSNEAWGDLAEHDHELAETWDRYWTLPDAGKNDILDAFCRRKHIDIPALLRLGARLADHGTLAFADRGYIKYRQMETGRRWTSADASFPRLKLISCQQGTTDTVIVCEGETDAARLSMLYPHADIASLPSGAKHVAPAYTAQLNEYRQVLVATDNDDAGNIGAAKIGEAVAHAQRFLAPEGGDWCTFDGATPGLPPLPTQDDRVGSIVFQSLTALLERGVPDPEVLVDDVLYTEGVHLFSGHPGCGKTTFVQHTAHAVMLEERHVVWLDYEAGLIPTVRRLLAVGIPAPLLAVRFHYAPFPRDAPAHLGAVAARWPGALIVLDSLSKALAYAGKSEKDNDEVTAFTVPIVQACKTHAMPIAIIDHVAKTGGGMYSRGAGAKLADVDVHWGVEKLSPFKRDRIGSLALHQHKDREGFLPDYTYWEVGDGAGALTLTPTDGPPPANEPDETQTAQPGI